jgi:hypothetical protein
MRSSIDGTDDRKGVLRPAWGRLQRGNLPEI